VFYETPNFRVFLLITLRTLSLLTKKANVESTRPTRRNGYRAPESMRLFQVLHTDKVIHTHLPIRPHTAAFAMSYISFPKYLDGSMRDSSINRKTSRRRNLDLKPDGACTMFFYLACVGAGPAYSQCRKGGNNFVPVGLSIIVCLEDRYILEQRRTHEDEQQTNNKEKKKPAIAYSWPRGDR